MKKKKPSANGAKKSSNNLDRVERKRPNTIPNRSNGQFKTEVKPFLNGLDIQENEILIE